MDALYKTPRIYMDSPLSVGAVVLLPEDVHHHLIHVLRKKSGDIVRAFNGRDGEGIGVLDIRDKKQAYLKITDMIRAQPPSPPARHLCIPPLKKDAMDWLVEKAVELGVTNLHPILTQQCDIRSINLDRIRAQIMEAACQCERLDLPMLNPLQPLDQVLQNWPVDIPLLAAVEREDIPLLTTVLPPPSTPCGLLIGPAGGWSDSEKNRLREWPAITPVSLGSRILRAETAAMAALSLLNIR